VLASRHETVLQGSEAPRARRRRRRDTQGGDRQDLLRVGADHQVLAQAPSRDRGRGAERAIPGRPSVKGAALEGWLPSHLQENPDLTLEEHREAFQEARGVSASVSTVGRAIVRLPGGWPLKKSRP
jgi:hypothetical protein